MATGPNTTALSENVEMTAAAAAAAETTTTTTTTTETTISTDSAFASSNTTPKTNETSPSLSLPSHTIVPPQLCAGGELEWSLHTLPKPLKREFHHVFGHLKLSSSDSCVLLAIPTNQRARLDLVNVGPVVEQEKDRLLHVFINLAQTVCREISSLQPHLYWADFMDPCSGLPMLDVENGSKVYSEVDGMECLLGYPTHNAGFCKVLHHPTWGSAVYPATIFCYCPPHVAQDVLQRATSSH